MTGVDAAGDHWVLRGDAFSLRAKRVVLAGGVWLEPMVAWFGLRLPIKTLVNQLSVTERVAPVMRTVIGIASGLLSLKQYPHGTVVIGGRLAGHRRSHDRRHGAGAGEPRRQCPARLHTIPALKQSRIARAWLGFEAETADALPAVGALPGRPGVHVIGSVHSGYTSGICIRQAVRHATARTHAASLARPLDPTRLVSA